MVRVLGDNNCWPTMRAAFFGHPTRVALAVWSASTFFLIIPTCIKLTPLGNDDRADSDTLVAAETQYNATEDKLAGIEAHIADDMKRYKDLGCAIAGYQRFNDDATRLQVKISGSTANAEDRLKLLWNMQFAADSITTQVTTKTVPYQVPYTYYTYPETCTHTSSGTHCVTNRVAHTGYHTYTYQQITTTENRKQNILTGNGYSIMPVDCGDYSRYFQVGAPQAYVSYQSPVITAGTRESGLVSISNYNEWSSHIPVSYTLDDSTANWLVEVPRDTSQADAAVVVEPHLFEKLVTAIAAFNATLAANYLADQQSYQAETPALRDTANAVNYTAQQQASVVAQQQYLFDNAHSLFTKGMSLWLPLLFLVPATLGILSFLLVRQCNSWYPASDDDNVVDLNNREVEPADRSVHDVVSEPLPADLEAGPAEADLVSHPTDLNALEQLSIHADHQDAISESVNNADLSDTPTQTEPSQLNDEEEESNTPSP